MSNDTSHSYSSSFSHSNASSTISSSACSSSPNPAQTPPRPPCKSPHRPSTPNATPNLSSPQPPLFDSTASRKTLHPHLRVIRTFTGTPSARARAAQLPRSDPPSRLRRPMIRTRRIPAHTQPLLNAALSHRLCYLQSVSCPTEEIKMKILAVCVVLSCAASFAGAQTAGTVRTPTPHKTTSGSGSQTGQTGTVRTPTPHPSNSGSGSQTGQTGTVRTPTPHPSKSRSGSQTGQAGTTRTPTPKPTSKKTHG